MKRGVEEVLGHHRREIRGLEEEESGVAPRDRGFCTPGRLSMLPKRFSQLCSSEHGRRTPAATPPAEASLPQHGSLFSRAAEVYKLRVAAAHLRSRRSTWVDFQRRATATELQSPASLKTHPGWLRDLYASFDDSSSDPGQPASSSTEQSYSTVSELLVPRAGRSLSRPRSGCLTRVLVEVCMA
jgi:hypothetical protein